MINADNAITAADVIFFMVMCILIPMMNRIELIAWAIMLLVFILKQHRSFIFSSILTIFVVRLLVWLFWDFGE